MSDGTPNKPAAFGAVLRRYRAATHLTQEQLAARAGLSPDAIAALERGKRRTPRGATVELLADALGLEAQERAQFVVAARAASGADSGAARDVDPRPRWLATEPTLLVDRVHDLDTIVRSLVAGDTRLLTLTGPAGVGKTRLALAAAARLTEDISQSADRFRDGVTWVDLAPIRDPDLALGAIARALGLLDVGSRPALERLAESLRDRRQLLALDNVEQILPAAASLSDLLAACPGLALLVTSRVPLRLRWEQTLRIAPFPVPNVAGGAPPRLEDLLAMPAVELFVSRAQAHRADFALTHAQAPLVAQLVRQLDGLPLALNLAAARMDVVPLGTLVRRVGDRLQLLRWEAQDLPERQQSLEAAVGWSYDLLSAEEQRLFRCLGVFLGRVSLDAMTAVATAVAIAVAREASVATSGGGGETVRDGRGALAEVLSLAEQSLIQPAQRAEDGWWQGDDVETDDEDADAEDAADLAFGMLETVREYAEMRLAAAGELEAARRAHAHAFLALAEQADPLLRGRDQRAWYFRLERDLDNLRTALRWLLDQDDDAERNAALRLASALGWFWTFRGYHVEGVRWLEEALDRAPAEGPGSGADVAVRTRALLAAGGLLNLQGEFARARAVLGEGLALAERQRDPVAAATALAYLGNSAVFVGEVAEAAHLLHEASRRWEALGDAQGLGQTLFYLGYAADAAGDVTAAAAHYTAALEQLDAVGDVQFAGIGHSYLGVAAWKRADLPRAVEHIQAGVRTSVALQNRWILSFPVQAAAALVGTHADHAARARLLGAADALAQATGSTFAWEWMPGGQDVMGLRERLARGEEGEELTAAYREGRALPVAQVAALALRLLEDLARTLPQPEAAPAIAQPQGQPPQPPPAQRTEPSLLSAREAEVLRLVAQGHSSKEIGRRLFLSPSTVNHHIQAIFNKLGVDTRAQAVAVAGQQGLL
jgi:predicted ATPase/DNA-binding CsgD family transcriptional regulator/transcriptional regulator with XRE-family HTH domain